MNYGNQLPLFYFYLHLFSFVYLCLLLFIQTGIPLGSECELWKSVAFISIYTCFLLFTYVCFCLSKRYSLRYLNWMWIMEIRCLCFTFVLICFFCLPLFTLVYKEKLVFLWSLKRMWIMEISCLCLPLFTFICTKPGIHSFWSLEWMRIMEISYLCLLLFMHVCKNWYSFPFGVLNRIR